MAAVASTTSVTTTTSSTVEEDWWAVIGVGEPHGLEEERNLDSSRWYKSG